MRMMHPSTERTIFPAMADSHHHHDHARDGTGNERRAALAFALTAGFMVVEAAGGWLSGSLALVADAAHMLTDSAALAMTWLAFRLGRLPPDARRSYGYRRAEVLAAFVNGLFVLALAAWIAWEAVARLSEPQPVTGPLMLAVAVGGVAVNLVVLRILGGHGHDEHGHEGHGHGNLNLRGALLHVMGDLLGSLAAVVAAGVIMVWGWTPVDPLLSLAVA
ncbi:MAG: cation diffusion facilitator family transporter, partial [Pseudomonadota bacterium]